MPNGQNTRMSKCVHCFFPDAMTCDGAAADQQVAPETVNCQHLPKKLFAATSLVTHHCDSSRSQETRKQSQHETPFSFCDTRAARSSNGAGGKITALRFLLAIETLKYGFFLHLAQVCKNTNISPPQKARTGT